MTPEELETWCHDRARELILNRGKSNIQGEDVTGAITDYALDDPDNAIWNRLYGLCTASTTLVTVTFAD